jgi:Beta-propeller domains of methanol dehydrogenase type
MKNIMRARLSVFCLGLLLCSIAVFCAGAASAAAAQQRVPPIVGLLNDTAGMVPADQRAELEQRLENFSKAVGGGQLVVLTIPTLDGEDIEGYAMRVFEAWKPGRKGIDDGALLLLARDDRLSRLEVGYGWEGEINDARAGDVLRNIAAYLAKGRTADGIASAIGQVQGYITGAAPEDVPPELGAEPPPPWWAMVIAVLIIVALLGFIIGAPIFFAYKLISRICRGSSSNNGSGGGSGSGSSSLRGSGSSYRSSSSGSSSSYRSSSSSSSYRSSSSGSSSRGGGGRSGGGGASGKW